MSDQSTTITPELVAPEDQKELIAVIHQNNLQVETAQSLQASFTPLFGQARILIEKSRGIVVTDASQTLEIKTARIHRLAFKALRVSGEKLHRELKDEYVRGGRAIDGFKNIFIHLVEGEENRLEEQEKFVERQEAKRKEALKVQRAEILVGIQADPSLYQLGEMSEETFQQLVEGVKLARAAAEQRRIKEEADRIAKEAADLAERERVRLENERLKKEADEKEAALKVEREAFAAQRKKEQDEAFAAAETARKEREAIEARAAEEKRKADAVLAEQKRKADETAAALKKEADEKARKAKAEADKRTAALKAENDRIQAELQKERDAQAKRAADAAEAERKAAAASAKDKLLNYANAIRAIEIPTDAQAIATVIKASRDKFCDWVEEKAGGL